MRAKALVQLLVGGFSKQVQRAQGRARTQEGFQVSCALVPRLAGRLVVGMCLEGRESPGVDRAD